MNEQERLIEVWLATCKAMQGVVRDLKITQDELLLAGHFFNRLGQSGMFPSLLNVGVGMTSVDVNRVPGSGTRPNMQGPFYKPGAPERTDGNLLEGPAGPGATLLYLGGRIADAATGQPLAGAELDFWQTDENGIYDHKGFNLCGVVRSDSQGRYQVKTVVPRDYSDHDSDPIGELFRAMGRHNRRAAHIHLKARMPGYVPLTTQIFMPDSDYLDSDYVEGAVSPDLTLDFRPRNTNAGKAVEAEFDVTLRRASVPA
jgi:catechol 1,2-dioxygenase